MNTDILDSLDTLYTMHTMHPDTLDVIDIDILYIVDTKNVDRMSMDILNMTLYELAFLTVIFCNKHCRHLNVNYCINVLSMRVNIFTCVVL